MWKEVLEHGMAIGGQRDLSTEYRTKPWTFAVSGSLPLVHLVHDYRAWKSSVEEKRAMPKSLAMIESAVVCVALTACRKGSFGRWDEIHHLSKENRNEWKTALQSVQSDPQSKARLQKLESQTTLSSESHIGAITSSNFSLSTGKVSAIASISLWAYLDTICSEEKEEEEEEEGRGARSVMKRERNPIPVQGLVLVRNVQGGVARAASLQVVSLS
jgi:hypothetical protein